MTTTSIPDKAIEDVKSVLASQGTALTKEEMVLLESVKGNSPVWVGCASALILKGSLFNHAKALDNVASKAETNSKALTRYTYWLALGTVGMLVISILQFIVFMMRRSG